MNNLTNITKEFEGTGVEIIIQNGEALFELYSAGLALGQVVRAKGKLYPNKARIDQNVTNAEISTVLRNAKQYLTESMLYDLMLEMKTDKVKPFRKWITNEVLPSIRKDGGYIAPTATPEQVQILNSKWIKQSIYLTEEIHDRKSLRKFIREYNPMQLDECIDKIADIVEPMKGSIKHELLDVAIKELKAIDAGLMKDTIKHTYIKDTAVAGIVLLQDIKIGKFKKRIKVLELSV